MSSKILYRRIIPIQQTAQSTLTHPHKTPTHPHTTPSTATADVTSTTDEDKKALSASQDSKSRDSEEEHVSSTTEEPSGTEPADEGSCKPLEEENQEESNALEQPPNKVTLGELTEIKGVIFDMDGTLTIPVLRFAEMKERLGLKPTDDILPTVQGLPPEERVRAFEIIEEFEREGVEKMKLQPGVLKLFQFLGERNVERALMTRNARTPPTEAFLKRLQEELECDRDKYPSLDSEGLFSKVITREFEPCKPHPAAVFEITKGWKLSPEQVAIVGDDKTDMICGLRAGVGVNILLRNERNMRQTDYSHFTVDSLSEIITLMSTVMTVPFKQEP